MKQLFLWGFGLLLLLVAFISSTTTTCVGFEFEFDEEDENLLFNLTDTISYAEEQYRVSNNAATPLYVPQTIIQGAAAKGAACLDGSPPAYHIDRGYGSGANNWVVNLEGGGWCYNTRTCAYRKNSRHGSSLHMEKQLAFTGILSNKAYENPDFFNWNRVKIRYCDGGSFTGDSYDKAAHLYYRGQRIYVAAMEELMSMGMRYAKQALLSGCSAGGLSTILHCDEFRKLFPGTTKVKCLSDAGLFLDAIDVSGGRTMRNMFQGVVNLQGVKNSLPWTCTNHLDATSCFFPQNLIANIKTPMFLLNAAYDSWQFVSSLAPPASDPHSNWKECKANHALCTASQIRYLQGFRNKMLNAVKGFATSRQNGLFINSCFAHCQSERQDTWFSNSAPLVHNKGIAKSVGDWYFDRSGAKSIDCPYPCDKTCHNLVFQ